MGCTKGGATESRKPSTGIRIPDRMPPRRCLGIDQQDDFDELAVAQGVPQCRSKSQQKSVQTIEIARENVARILIALGRSEWRRKTGMEPYARRQRENASAMKSGKNEVNH